MRVFDYDAVHAAWSAVAPSGARLVAAELLQGKKGKAQVWRLHVCGGVSDRVIAKRATVAESQREYDLYREVLAVTDISAPLCFGVVPDPESKFAWLFLEDVAAAAYSPASGPHRALAGSWLGSTHATCVDVQRVASLPDVGPPRYEAMLPAISSELSSACSNPVLDAEDVAVLSGLVRTLAGVHERWEVVRRLHDPVPQTLVHGSFSHRNMQVRQGTEGPRLVVFDWAAAGWGTPARDLAKLVGDRIDGDLQAYRRAVRARCPQLADDGVLGMLVWSGQLFRAIEHLRWITPKLQYEWVAGPMALVARHGQRLSRAARQLDEYAEMSLINMTGGSV